jgi:hypothetical protein
VIKSARLTPISAIRYEPQSDSWKSSLRQSTTCGTGSRKVKAMQVSSKIDLHKNDAKIAKTNDYTLSEIRDYDLCFAGSVDATS